MRQDVVYNKPVVDLRFRDVTSDIYIIDVNHHGLSFTLVHFSTYSQTFTNLVESFDVVTDSYRHIDMANMTGTATTGQDSFQIKSNGNVSTRSEPLPIVIVGGGCVGLFLALVLCQFDVPNRVMVHL
jgi:hypothetical protein